VVASYQFPELDIEVLQTNTGYLHGGGATNVWTNPHPNDQIRILNQVFFDKFQTEHPQLIFC
jgi:hypothetical protein